MVEVPLKLYVQGLLKQAKSVARPMACLSSEQKNQALQAMADALVAQTSDILEANERDLQLIPKDEGQQAHRQAAEQIRIDEDDIQHMVEALLDFLAYPDPVGEMTACPYRPCSHRRIGCDFRHGTIDDGSVLGDVCENE
jgi:glutamate-5-semialdehyde dehydrogenase